MREEILSIVLNKLREIGTEKKEKVLINCNDNTPIYGSKGLIDSITLVMLVSDIEEDVEDRYDKIITLADEKAMSQKNSPFRSPNSLTDYILKLIAEN